MARQTLVENNRKEQTCGRCRKTIAKNEGYLYATPGFRGHKLIRCRACGFRSSELTTSKLSGVYAANEDIEDACEAFGKADLSSKDERASALDDLKLAIENAADAIDEIAQEYDDAAEAMGGAGEEMREKSEECSSYADELRSIDLDDYEEAEANDSGTEETEPSEDDEDGSIEEWRQEVLSVVGDVVSGCSL